MLKEVIRVGKSHGEQSDLQGEALGVSTDRAGNGNVGDGSVGDGNVGVGDEANDSSYILFRKGYLY